MPERELVHIVIDGHALSVPKGEMIIESARRIGIEIPHFCYHPRLSKEAGANCRMCLVEVSMPRRNPDGTTALAKMPKPQTSCSLPASEGMVIETQTPAIVEARRGILEFLLINHPLDCPICDRGGECPLQNNTLHYGPPTTRFVEEKRHVEKAYRLSEHVVLDRERCIHCARCTRFTEDVSGDAQLGFLKRGADMLISAQTGAQFTSLFSGNVIELCPVGALLSRDYRFRARPWDLATQKSLCTECGNGCNVKLDHRVGKPVRVNARTNEAVNEEWTCDRGKFGMTYLAETVRIRKPLVREGERFTEASWRDALDIVAERLRSAGRNAAFVGGVRSSNEDLYAIQRLFREVLGSANLDHRLGPGFTPACVVQRTLGHDGALDSIAGLEDMRSIIVFGSDLAVEQPIVYLRVRKAWRLGRVKVIEVQPATKRATGPSNRLAAFAEISAYYEPAECVRAAWNLLAAVLAGNPMYSERVADSTRAKLRSIATDHAEQPLQPLSLEGPVTVLVGADVARSERLADVLEPLAALAAAVGNARGVAIPALHANEQGARVLGILPDVLPGFEPCQAPGSNTLAILEGARSGRISALWVSGMDLVREFADVGVASQCLESAPFVLYTGFSLDETARMADVVLPLTNVAERDGTYTNVERRVQRFWKAYEPSHDGRDEWWIAASLADRLGSPMPYVSWSDVLTDIAQTVPGWQRCRPEDLGDAGVPYECHGAEVLQR